MERNRGNVHVFMPSRRRFLQNSLALGAIAVPERPTSATLETRATDGISLDGEWMFRTDPQDTGEKLNWQTSTEPLTDWRTVTVPHTWQIERPLTEYRGVAWYRREFDTPRAAPDSAIRIEFEAVFYSARIWINGKPAGEHLRKAYTAFTCDTGRLLLEARPNTLVVRVHNSFNEQMLPRGRSSDWAHDGGIYRPVTLLGYAEDLYRTRRRGCAAGFSDGRRTVGDCRVRTESERTAVAWRGIPAGDRRNERSPRA